VTSIGAWVFWGCHNLADISIPDSDTSIGNGAFLGCSVTSVTIPQNVTNIGRVAFVGCPRLAGITVDASNAVYSSVAGVLFDKSQTTLIQCPAGRAGNYTIPASVTNIGEEAFLSCSSLTSVTIPASVTGIGDDAFGGCSNAHFLFFLGNAPATGSSGSIGDSYYETVAYLPETKGWGSTYGGPLSLKVPYGQARNSRPSLTAHIPQKRHGTAQHIFRHAAGSHLLVKAFGVCLQHGRQDATCWRHSRL